MADRNRSFPIDDLPSHLILEILTSGKRLRAVDLASLELTSRTFGGSHGVYPTKCRSLVDLAAFQLCTTNETYIGMSYSNQRGVFERCGGNWKRVLRFLQSVEQSSDMVQTSAGNMQITTGRYHTLLIRNSSVYSCGSSLCGVLGHGPETTQCVVFTRINFPSPANVIQVSASQNHAAFVLRSGEVAAGLNFTVFLTRQGHVYTCGTNIHGQLGHGDSQDRPSPKMVELLERVGTIVQIAAGPSYVLAVTDNGVVYSFGSGSNFCLGHGEQQNEFHPRAIQTFKRKGIHVLSVSAGDEHVVAVDSSGYVYTWGKGYCGELGHGDEIDKTLPQHLVSLKSQLAVQVCARKRKTFVLVDGGAVYGFGWMGFGSLGFPDRGVSDKIMRPRILDCLRGHRVSQVSTGLYHTVVVTQRGRMFGFGTMSEHNLVMTH
ncbi:putative E3 ubiquitin-protein ligase HERC2-like isoform X2 [Hibiscus syriacus]|uniref:E3 ubiquitin-protein ligase HERC2-like isoform X2 n=1 Tax=Hibiscus syriacus TaxID=106335 RepID=A0A6A2ZLE3_HIBSY|nr:putative E3 ubiquitin-protein ligase HERC2-like isoform X2 [Hibiscus syriacus]